MSVVLTNQIFRFKVTRTVRGTVDVDAATEDEARQKIESHHYYDGNGRKSGDVEEIGDWEEWSDGPTIEREDA